MTRATGNTAPRLVLTRNACVVISKDRTDGNDGPHASTSIPLAPRDAALLAWLALEGPTPRSRLAALLWPDSDVHAARNSLRQRLFTLRRTLGFDAVVGSVTLALADGLEHDLADADSVLGDAEAVVVGGDFAQWLEQQRSRRPARLHTTLAGLAQQRLLRLGSLALKLARCAALAGPDLSPTLAAQVLGLRPLDLADAWAELESAQVLSGCAFAHDLIAEAALALVPQAIASTLHGEIAAVLERGPGEPARIAAHWLAADEPHKAVPHLTRAAQRAHAAWQRGQAADLYEQAAAILAGAGDAHGAFDAYFSAAEAASQAQGRDQSSGRDRLVTLGQTLQQLAADDGQRAAAALLPIFLLNESRQSGPARALALQALPWAQRAGLADIEIELLWFVALTHLDAGELNDAARCVGQALQRLPAVDAASARLQHLGTRFKLA